MPAKEGRTLEKTILLRDVAAEVIEELKERGNLRADCPLYIVDFEAHCEDPGSSDLAAR
jgi:hypothetical protein